MNWWEMRLVECERPLCSLADIDGVSFARMYEGHLLLDARETIAAYYREQAERK